MTNEQPIETKYLAKMNVLATAIDEVFNGEARGENRTVGFVLLAFDFGEPKGQRMNYISNGSRKDVIASLRELIASFEGRRLPDQYV